MFTPGRKYTNSRMLRNAATTVGEQTGSFCLLHPLFLFVTSVKEVTCLKFWLPVDLLISLLDISEIAEQIPVRFGSTFFIAVGKDECEYCYSVAI